MLPRWFLCVTGKDYTIKHEKCEMLQKNTDGSCHFSGVLGVSELFLEVLSKKKEEEEEEDEGSALFIVKD